MSNTTLKSLINENMSKVTLSVTTFEQPYMSGGYVDTGKQISGDLQRGGSFWLALTHQSNSEAQQDALMGGISVQLPPHGNSRIGPVVVNPRSVDGMFGGATGKQRAIGTTPGKDNTFIECMTVPKETPTIIATQEAPVTRTLELASANISSHQIHRAEIGRLDNMSGASTFNGSQPITIIEGNRLKQLFDWKSSIGGRATSGHIKNSLHYQGLALDFMLPSDYKSSDAQLQGAKLAEYVRTHMDELNVTEVIFNKQVASSKNPNWHPYNPPKYEQKNDTTLHIDHVHIGFKNVDVPNFQQLYKQMNGELKSLHSKSSNKQNNVTSKAKEISIVTPKIDAHIGGNGQSVYSGTKLFSPRVHIDQSFSTLSQGK